MCVAVSARSRCGGKCCSSVPVTQEEAGRILQALPGDLPFSEVFRVTNAGTFTRWIPASSPFPSLRVRRCILYDQVTGLCRAYQARPQICWGFDCVNPG